MKTVQFTMLSIIDGSACVFVYARTYHSPPREVREIANEHGWNPQRQCQHQPLPVNHFDNSCYVFPLGGTYT